MLTFELHSPRPAQYMLMWKGRKIPPQKIFLPGSWTGPEEVQGIKVKKF